MQTFYYHINKKKISKIKLCRQLKAYSNKNFKILNEKKAFSTFNKLSGSNMDIITLCSKFRKEDQIHLIMPLNATDEYVIKTKTKLRNFIDLEKFGSYVQSNSYITIDLNDEKIRDLYLEFIIKDFSPTYYDIIEGKSKLLKKFTDILLSAESYFIIEFLIDNSINTSDIILITNNSFFFEREHKVLIKFFQAVHPFENQELSREGYIYQQFLFLIFLKKNFKGIFNVALNNFLISEDFSIKHSQALQVHIKTFLRESKKEREIV